MSSSLTASITTTPPLTVSQFYTPASATPGNVGLCLSGGGTRACCAGMGQLRALASLQANGASLLAQVKAISTVSGGSWLGVPYTFLPAAGPSDAAYLGSYDSDQGALTLAELATLPTGNAGLPMTSFMFSLEGIAGTAVLLYELYLKSSPTNPLPANLLWQTVMALNILLPYGLVSFASDGQPQDMFSATAASLKAITSANGSLSGETAYTFADGAANAQRPYLVCNMGMFVNVKDVAFQLLAPVQATGFFTGVVGAPAGATDANQATVGGGGVDSFAFNSTFEAQSGTTATVTQTRQWSLTDIMGTSSAAFSETVQNQIAQWKADPLAFAKWLLEEGDAIWKWLESHLPAALHADARALVARGAAGPEAVATFSFPDPQDLEPQYPSWSAGAAAANPTANKFADGGSLENNGLASLLAYTDLDSVIVCVNSEVPLSQGTPGIADGSGGFVAGTNVLVDDSVPPLFGYQPADGSKGYVLFSAGGVSPENQLFGQSQVFASSEFAGFLQGLWSAAGSTAPATAPAILSQSLTVQANTWFGVPAGTSPMTIVWVYLDYASDWAAQFASNTPVQTLVASELANNQFPNYSTLSTELSATQINLLAHLSSWAVVTADQTSKVFSNLFASSSKST